VNYSTFYMDPAEIEFLAEKEPISIVPNFSLDRIYLITGDVGPFNPGLNVEVPLWLATALKQRQKCHIVPPVWMDVEVLEKHKANEEESKFFTEMPSKYYREVTQLLLQHAADDIARADVIRTLVKDIWDLRLAKLRSSVDVFLKSDATHAKLNHLTRLELNTIRPFLTSALDHLHMLRANASRGASVVSQD